MNFALIGVGGYIAPRHIEAVRDLGHNLVAAYDISDSVGLLDRYFPDCMFFTKLDKFDAFISSQKIDYVSICSPNHMHLEHAKFALSRGINVICEKPMVLFEDDIDELLKFENEYDKKVFTVLQLRVHEAILKLKNLVAESSQKRHEIDLTYITSRGQWYHESWKGDVNKSGGLSTNIGVHFFDMLTWIFGSEIELSITEKNATRESGLLKLDKADVRWSLSIDRKDLPKAAAEAGKTTFRSIKIDGKEFEFSEGFTELHKTVYKNIFNGNGYGPEDSRAAIRIVEKIRNS